MLFRSKTEEIPKIITDSTSAYTEAGSSEVVSEKLTEESLPEKPSAPAPKHIPRVTWTISFDMLQESN